MSAVTRPPDLDLDGISFLPQLQGKPGTPKAHIFCYYDKGKHPIEGQAPRKARKQAARSGKTKASHTRWVRDKQWKLYDNGKLFDVAADPDEQQAIQNGVNPAADQIRRRFQTVLDNMAQESQSRHP